MSAGPVSTPSFCNHMTGTSPEDSRTSREVAMRRREQDRQWLENEVRAWGALLPSRKSRLFPLILDRLEGMWRALGQAPGLRSDLVKYDYWSSRSSASSTLISPRSRARRTSLLPLTPPSPMGVSAACI